MIIHYNHTVSPYSILIINSHSYQNTGSSNVFWLSNKNICTFVISIIHECCINRLWICSKKHFIGVICNWYMGIVRISCKYSIHPLCSISIVRRRRTFFNGPINTTSINLTIYTIFKCNQPFLTITTVNVVCFLVSYFVFFKLLVYFFLTQKQKHSMTYQIPTQTHENKK